MDILVKPIGEVRNNVKEPLSSGWGAVVSELVIDDKLKEALEGLEQFSHIIVFFWMHKVSVEQGVSLKVHPRRREDLPLVGLFATRTPHRPNPVGMSIVRLIGCRGNTLKVEGLDAIDGTPVIDIKPYLPRDIIADAVFPEWVARL